MAKLKSMPFAPAVRERAVRLVLAYQGEYEPQWAAIQSITAKGGGSCQSTPDVTTAGNALMARIPHDRMPVILDPRHYDAWLDPATPIDEAQDMLQPAPDGLLTMWRVSARVNSGAHDDPACLEPLAESEP